MKTGGFDFEMNLLRFKIFKLERRIRFLEEVVNNGKRF
jgi:hypothetical protein